jgi:hypothetical protein
MAFMCQKTQCASVTHMAVSSVNVQKSKVFRARAEECRTMAALFHGERTRALLLRLPLIMTAWPIERRCLNSRMRIAKRASFHQARWHKHSLVRRSNVAALGSPGCHQRAIALFCAKVLGFFMPKLFPKGAVLDMGCQQKMQKKS